MQQIKRLTKNITAQKTRSILTASTTICATCMITCLIAFYLIATETIRDEIGALNKNTKITLDLVSHGGNNIKLDQSQFEEKIMPHFQNFDISSAKRSYTAIHTDQEKRNIEYFELIF